MHVHLNSDSIHIFVVINSLSADVQGGQKQPLTFVNGGQLKLELCELCAAHILYYLFQCGHFSSFLLYAGVSISLLALMHSLHPAALFVFTLFPELLP